MRSCGQVLQDRGETGSRHGRGAFAVLLLQDLAVVVLLMLIPLLAPSEAGPSGFSKIAKALGIAAIKVRESWTGCGTTCDICSHVSAHMQSVGLE